jgi:hypothetical protein
MNMPAKHLIERSKTLQERWFTSCGARSCCDVLSQVLIGEHPLMFQQRFACVLMVHLKLHSRSGFHE